MTKSEIARAAWWRRRADALVAQAERTPYKSEREARLWALAAEAEKRAEELENVTA
jgi:hypothetical protein